MENIDVGLKGESHTVVTTDQMARHLGSGGINVYATPSMIALMEGAAVAAIDHMLPDGQASVGISLEVKHLAATPKGQKIKAEAEVISIDGRQVKFIVKAWNEYELIGEGSHTRFIIDINRFLQKLEKKQG